VNLGVCGEGKITRIAIASEHNNANMISIGARMVSEDEAIKILDTWLNAEFEYGRHMRRIEKLEQGDEPVSPAT
jgi:ribose 5-phosphate isomerase B